MKRFAIGAFGHLFCARTNLDNYRVREEERNLQCGYVTYRVSVICMPWTRCSEHIEISNV